MTTACEIHHDYIHGRVKGHADYRPSADYDALAARIRDLEAALRFCQFYMRDVKFPTDHPMALVISKALTATETACEPLPRLECGMGCGRTFCSIEGREHHEELCSGKQSDRGTKQGEQG